MLQDGALDSPQPRTRFDAELLHQCPPSRPVNRERLCLPPASVQRDHQLLVKPLAQWVIADQRLQLTDQVPMTAKGEVSLNPVLDHTSSNLLQPGDLPLREPLLAHIGQGRTAPECQCLTKVRRCPIRHAIHERATAPRSQALETADVNTLLGSTQHVGTGPRQHHRASSRGLQCPPEPRDIDLQRVLRASGRMFPPQTVDEHITRHRHIGAQHKNRKQRSLLLAADIQNTAVEVSLNRPK